MSDYDGYKTFFHCISIETCAGLLELSRCSSSRVWNGACVRYRRRHLVWAVHRGAGDTLAFGGVVLLLCVRDVRACCA